jgi:cation diffusion facilitator family transporter
MKAVVAALAANLGIAIAKFIAFLITGSASMLAESVHSVADTGNEALLLIGHGRSRRARTTEHPFGFGRERYFYGFVVAVMLFTVGSVFSLYDGIHKIISPEPLQSPIVAYVVLALSFVLEGLSLRTAVLEANQHRGEHGLRAFVHITKTPELPVVLLEDTAALLGLVFAFLGVLLSQVTGHDEWDGAGSVGIGVLLACAAFIVGYETKSLLIGESATEEDSRKIVAALESGPESFKLIHLRTSHIGPESLLVAAKIAVSGKLTAADLAAGINAAEGRIRAALPIAETIYLEPDIYHPDEADGTDPSIQVVRRSRSRLRRGGRGTALPALRNRRGGGVPSQRRARSFSKSRARPGVAGT